MNNQEPLEACPFCGNKAYVDDINLLYGVTCCTINCIILPERYKTKEQAIKAWNTRPTQDNDEFIDKFHNKFPKSEHFRSQFFSYEEIESFLRKHCQPKEKI